MNSSRLLINFRHMHTTVAGEILTFYLHLSRDYQPQTDSFLFPLQFFGYTLSLLF